MLNMKNVDNSNKSQSGSFSNSSLDEQLSYLKKKELITSYSPKKYGYEGKRKGQFKCDFVVNFPNGDVWILFSAASLTSDRLKTKQWDAENIKKINNKISKAFVVCPDSTKSIKNILRYREYIRSFQDVSFVDDILLHSELVSMIENYSLGTILSGSKAAKKGLNFEDLVVNILENEQNLKLWKGNKLAAGFQYHIFELIMNKLNLSPMNISSFEANNDIPNLPKYTYKDGTTKKGGMAKTDVMLTAHMIDGSTSIFTFSCKNTTKSDVTVFQFPPKYCVDVLDITEEDTEELLMDYVRAGGPTKMSKEKADLLTARLKPYISEFNRWVLHGIDNDGSCAFQRADYIITRYQKASGEKLYIETIDECINAQYELGNTHFGTAFSWTVTKTSAKGERYPSLSIRYR